MPYSAFLSSTYRTCFPRSSCTCLRYNIGSILTRSSAIFPSSFICTVSSMSACIKAPGMSTVATSRFSIASMTHDNITASIATVGELASSFVMCCRCFLPSAQPRPLIVPLRFFFKNIRYCNAAFFSSSDISVSPRGSRTFLSCSCRSSLRTASTPASPNSFRPRLMLCWVITICSSVACRCP